MSRARKFTVMALVALMAASHSYASTMTFAVQRPDQQNLRWKARQIRISLSNSLTQPSFNIKPDSDVLGAVMRSLRAWEGAADIEFVTDISEKQGISPSASGDGVSLITIAQTPENVLLFSREPDRESAKTRVFYNKGAITEADIVLNPFQQFSTDGTYGTFDLQATLTHEIGHMLGLRHSAVLGAIMSESLPKNGAFGITDLGSRSLSRNDVAAVRDLYDFDGGEVACCGMINGRVTNAGSRPSKGTTRIWAEESESGRVVAQTEAGPDGAYRIGGLPDGTYSVYWQIRDDESSFSGELGSAAIQSGGSVTLSGKIPLRLISPAIEFVGINGLLANTAVPVKPGRDYIVFLGGKDLETGSVGIQFSSSFIRTASGLYSRPDLGDKASVVSFVISIDQNAPSGLYSIFASGANGAKASLIGAIRVE
jgi:hypothetical protein